MSRERILLVTGKLAAPALRRVVAPLAEQAGFAYEIEVLGISVAALMHADWVGRKLPPDLSGFDRALLPGWCQGDLQALSARFGIPFVRGPKDLHNLPEFFQQPGDAAADLTAYDIEIIAEINHAPRLADGEILSAAEKYRRSGADVIDLGCVPGEVWDRAGSVTRLLRSEGFRVSIDSFDRREVEAAVEAGAELVLSCHGGNVAWASRLGAEVVAIPDEPQALHTLDSTLEILRDCGARFRIDPILEPIGFGLAASLDRYFQVRRRWPDAEMLMGIGNLTELTEVDSAGLNVLLAGICQELGIRSVLTTEVITWCRTAVAEFDLARRLVCHCVRARVLPKHLDSRLVMLRDARLPIRDEDELQDLAGRLTDPSYRIFVERGEIHVMNRDGYWRGRDAFELFDRMLADSQAELDVAHAFYLGYELAKAVTALTLGKKYEQDEALSWGFLTVPETSAHARRKAGNVPG